MIGKVYLSYWAVFNKLEIKEGICYSVSNSIFTNKPITRAIGLEPESFLWDYKNNRITWEEFVIKYKNQLNNTQAKATLAQIENFLQAGVNVWLFCCEKSHPCHRFIIGDLLKSKGYVVESIESVGDLCDNIER